jgi:hypothetical protein
MPELSVPPINNYRNNKKWKGTHYCVQAPCHEGIWGVKVKFQAFLMLGHHAGKWSPSCCSHFTPTIHWKAGWVDSRANLDSDDEEKNSCQS